MTRIIEFGSFNHTRVKKVRAIPEKSTVAAGASGIEWWGRVPLGSTPLSLSLRSPRARRLHRYLHKPFYRSPAICISQPRAPEGRAGPRSSFASRCAAARGSWLLRVSSFCASSRWVASPLHRSAMTAEPCGFFSALLTAPSPLQTSSLSQNAFVSRLIVTQSMRSDRIGVVRGSEVGTNKQVERHYLTVLRFRRIFRLHVQDFNENEWMGSLNYKLRVMTIDDWKIWTV